MEGSTVYCMWMSHMWMDGMDGHFSFFFRDSFRNKIRSRGTTRCSQANYLRLILSNNDAYLQSVAEWLAVTCTGSHYLLLSFQTTTTLFIYFFAKFVIRSQRGQCKTTSTSTNVSSGGCERDKGGYCSGSAYLPEPLFEGTRVEVWTDILQLVRSFRF